MRLPRSLGLPLQLLPDLLRVVTLLNELAQFLRVLLTVLVVLVGVVGLEADRQELQCAFLRAKGWILRAPVAELGKTLHHDVAEMVLQEGGAVVPLGDLLEVTLLLELYRQLVRQFHHLVQCRILLELSLALGRRGEEVLVLVHQAKESIASC